MSIVLVSRNPHNSTLTELDLLRFHGEFTTNDPEGIVRIGEVLPDFFFPKDARTWAVSETFKGIIERELHGIEFDPVFCNRLINDPGDDKIAAAMTRHLLQSPDHGVLDYFPDIEEFHHPKPSLYWMRLPMFGTGKFLPEITELIVKNKIEHIFLDERAYLAYVLPHLSNELIEKVPIFTIHSSLALSEWMFAYLEPHIDKHYYQVSSLYGA